MALPDRNPRAWSICVVNMFPVADKLVITPRWREAVLPTGTNQEKIQPYEPGAMTAIW